MRYFLPGEFRHYEEMDSEFLLFLDEERSRSGVPHFLTSDARSAEHNASVGGWEGSLHIFSDVTKGRAVDFVIPAFREGRRPFVDFSRIFKAAVGARDWLHSNGTLRQKYGIECEIVYSSRDKHLHLALFRNERPDELIVAVD